MKRNARLNHAARALVTAIGLGVLIGGCSHTAAPQATPPSDTARKVEAKKPDYSPYPDQQFPNRVYWGVAHVHTGFSFDSGMFGVTTTPDDLFRVLEIGDVIHVVRIDHGAQEEHGPGLHDPVQFGEGEHGVGHVLDDLGQDRPVVARGRDRECLADVPQPQVEPVRREP